MFNLLRPSFQTFKSLKSAPQKGVFGHDKKPVPKVAKDAEKADWMRERGLAKDPEHARIEWRKEGFSDAQQPATMNR
ncbi:MAG: hypothetical protein DRP22_04775 [Verrucomicrobia bacterium]|nr:MAG: hypothetical protein DRP22_04775 [Verrucomicrobiota bacterium]